MQARQGMWTQIAIGASFGLCIAFASQHEKWYMAYDEFMVGQIVGGMIGGIFWYCLLYRFWPRKKQSPPR